MAPLQQNQLAGVGHLAYLTVSNQPGFASRYEPSVPSKNCRMSIKVAQK